MNRRGSPNDMTPAQLRTAIEGRKEGRKEERKEGTEGASHRLLHFYPKRSQLNTISIVDRYDKAVL